MRCPCPARRLAIACALVVLGALPGCGDGGLRSALYPAPPPRPIEPREGGRVVEFVVASGGTGYALHHPAAAGGPTLVFFHGNGDQIAHLTGLGAAFERRGLGFYAVEYPGYGPATGMDTTESTIYATADAALAHLETHAGVARGEVVLMGQSLGTGVAAEMAGRGAGARLVLISPFTSIPDLVDALVASPAGLLVTDRFDTHAKAPSIGVPVLIAHGDRDTLIPIAMARTLDERFPDSALHVIETAGHNDVWAIGGAAWLDRIEGFARGDSDRAKAHAP